MYAWRTRYFCMAVILLLTACAQQPPRAAGPPAGFLTDEGEAAYHVFVAELALHRDALDTAAREYLQAARLSEDAVIAERAATIAYAAQFNDIAWQAAQLWLARVPDNLDAHRMLVSLAVRRGLPEQAVPHLEYLLANGPQDREDAWLMLMIVLDQESDGATAVAALSAQLALHPEEAEAHYALAALALDADQPAAALAAAQRTVALAPDWARAGLMLARARLAMGDSEAGIAAARAVVLQHDDDQVKLEFAGLLADHGVYDEAREVLAALLSKRPDMPDALFAAGLLELRAERPEQARVHFTHLLGTGQRRLDALYFLASVAEQMGESANALQLYLRVRSGRHFASAQIQVGRLLFKLGQRDAAIEHLRTFARRFPRHTESAVLVEGGLLSDIGEQAEALELYSETLDNDPDARTVRYARALLYEQMDRVEDALADLFLLVETDPQDGNALNALGYTLADRTDRLGEALGYIERALLLLPGEGAVLDSMGWVQYRLGNYEAALNYLERAWEQIKDPEVAAHLGEVLWVTGETERATEIWSFARAFTDSNRALNETMARYLGENKDE